MAKAARYTDLGDAPQAIVEKIDLAGGIVEFAVRSPLIAQAAQAGPVRARAGRGRRAN